MVFPVVMYGCESWAVKKAGCWRIDAFELWCWGRLLRVPWTARRSNLSILKEISPDYSLEGLMLKLKLQHWPPDAKHWLIGKGPDAGRDWGQEEKGTTEDEMAGLHHQHNGHEFESTPGVGNGQGGLVCCSSWGHKESDKTEWLNWNWTKLCTLAPLLHRLLQWDAHIPRLESSPHLLQLQKSPCTVTKTQHSKKIKRKIKRVNDKTLTTKPAHNKRSSRVSCYNHCIWKAIQ